MKITMGVGVIAAVTLLSGCSGGSAHGNASPSPVKNVADTAAFHGSTDGNHAAAKGGSSGGTAGDVNCSEYGGGKVGASGGPQVDLIAISSSKGTPGCTEAFNVITEYYSKAPEQGEGPGRRVLDILGHWDCAKAAEPAGSQGAVSCNKDGDTALRIETAPSKDATPASPPKLRFPNTIQTVQFTGFDNAANMAQFQLITWQPGGADGGHYVPVAGDTNTHRLPLNEHSEVYSATTVCSGDDATVDEKGFGTKPCTLQQLMEALTGGNPPTAQIHVGGDDSISVVKEIYHP